jgi:hypothetical protein
MNFPFFFNDDTRNESQHSYNLDELPPSAPFSGTSSSSTSKQSASFSCRLNAVSDLHQHQQQHATTSNLTSSLINLMPFSSASSSATLSLFKPTTTTSGNAMLYSNLITPPNNGASLHEKITSQQSTPIRSQLLDSHKTISKSKKLGQILKLASVRGAKVR